MPVTRLHKARKPLIAVGIIFFCALFFLAIFWLPPAWQVFPLDFSRFSNIAAGIGLPIGAILYFFCLRRVQGFRLPEQWTLKRAGKAFILTVGYVIFSVLLPSLALGAANIYLDKSEPVHHDVLVLSKHKRHSRHGIRYYLRFQLWRPGYGTEDIRVTRAQFECSLPHFSKLRIWTRKGGLGFEWVSNYYLFCPVTLPIPMPSEMQPIE